MPGFSHFAPMVVVRLVGGLGNQLFEYAAARRLALKNNVPLKLDTISGFQRDSFRRHYALSSFYIQEHFAAPADCFLTIGGRVKRKIMRECDKRQPFERRRYIQEEFCHFDQRLVDLKVTRKIYLEGCWQSIKYFEDIEPVIRQDLRFKPIVDPHYQALAEQIQKKESVCVHIRHLRDIAVDDQYYKRAMTLISERVRQPHFFVFSDDPAWAANNFLIDGPKTIISPDGAHKDYHDLWLMSCCKYFIIAYSTFSWWGAWLSDFANKVVIAPADKFDNKIDMIPRDWIAV